MIEVTEAQLMHWVTLFLWPFFRLLAFVAAAPVFGESAIPRLAKIGMAAALTVLIAPTLPPMPEISPISYAGIWLIVQQLLIGVALGLVMRVVFAAIMAAGDFIGLQMGLSFASFFSSEAQGNTMILARLFNLFAVLMFLAFDGHLIMIQLLIETFQRLPVGAGTLNTEGFRDVATYGSVIFSAGMLLAIPLITALLIINLSMGILNRASPQFSVFSVGFPITLLTGVTLLTFMTPELGSVFQRIFEQGLQHMVEIVVTLAGG
ncbi:flagellar biosynthetic protein FliR [Kushneria phosphatilytica]|uniref:Flagellar biosynthetic protein FliR n=1 Tax=Kushneria phosphatilytica TaxID=657387 RepID=A0A1S1NXB6_9GAMM|nr:flagellar biosynthetic protein FliR [Kushneria phosphatilytica]OHV12016.1 flagellar biosynthetic protein FliR [Kushneria phosphatilytica]QEL11208.1 flagellar biosynthetic protein FliR [Kushneria phosphatilytica]